MDRPYQWYIKLPKLNSQIDLDIIADKTYVSILNIKRREWTFIGVYTKSEVSILATLIRETVDFDGRGWQYLSMWRE